jgi:protein-L-isoaspartate(D-aspartate) O-methyltransferase
MAPDVITELALPVRYVNASLTSATEPPWWISARLLHGENPEIAHALLDQAREAEPQPDFFLGGHDVREAFNAFVLARSNHPASLGGSQGWGIGTGVKGSIAVVLPNGALLATGTQQAHDELAVLRDEWISLGKPHHESLAPTFVQTGDGWLVHLELRKLG